jgi:DNA-binding transcriptional LysR family regulator
MELSRIDLNLLLVFHHLLILKRVSAVAALLNMSQPAVSSALGRLRATLGDDLFLRTQRGMEPTPYTLQLAEPVANALDVLQQALIVRAAFDPKTSTRNFTIAMTDVGEMYFLPVLIDALSRLAPNVTLQIVSVTSSSLKEDMSTGQVDLALGLLPQLQAGFFQQALFRQKYTHPAWHKLALAWCACPWRLPCWKRPCGRWRLTPKARCRRLLDSSLNSWRFYSASSTV